MGKARDIAIIGGGGAGLAAAWLLGDHANVTLYEKDARLGGHARTVAFPTSSGEIPVDLGVVITDPWTYPNIYQLFDLLQVNTHAMGVKIGASFGPGDFWLTDRLAYTQLGQRVLSDCSRFELEMATLGDLPQSMQRLPLRELLQQGGYGAEFINKVLTPALGSLLVLGDGFLDMPTEYMSLLFRHYFTFFSSKTWRLIEGGTQEYISRLAARLDAKVLLSTPVSSVRRLPEGVIVTSACGDEARYDDVVIATNAPVARRLLADPSEAEAELIDAFEYGITTVYLHGDQRVLSPHLPFGDGQQYRYLGPHVGPTLRGTSSYIPGLGTGPEAPVITYAWEGTEGPLPQRDIVDVVRWAHYAPTLASYAAMRSLHQIQGVRRTWFCGAYTTPVPIHESALVSGMVVAEALGAAYPFASASQAARHHAAIRELMLP